MAIVILLTVFTILIMAGTVCYGLHLFKKYLKGENIESGYPLALFILIVLSVFTSMVTSSMLDDYNGIQVELMEEERKLIRDRAYYKDRY